VVVPRRTERRVFLFQPDNRAVEAIVFVEEIAPE
jgi:hypothetical protein